MTKNNAAILITGGSKRIGREIALNLAEAGYDIIINYNNSNLDAIKLKEDIEKLYKIKVGLIQGDVRKWEDCSKIITETYKDFPNLAGLINNASIFDKSSFFATNEDILDDYIETHLKGPFCLTQIFAKLVKKGNIINILDNDIDHNANILFTYNLSKKMLASFTKMSARILAPDIRVNAIAPGSILPSLSKSHEEILEDAKKLPLRRAATAKDIADAVKMLLTNDYIVGHTIYVDSGEFLL